MTRQLKWKLYLTLSVLFFSGIVYAIPVYWDRWFFIDVALPVSGHSVMTLHGLGAFVSIFLFGYLYRCHAMVHLRGNRHRKTGISLLTLMFVLIATGFGLYYLGDQTWRLWTGDIHCLLGVVLPLGLLAHRFPALIRRRHKLAPRSLAVMNSVSADPRLLPDTAQPAQR